MLQIDIHSGQTRRSRAPASRFPERFWAMYCLHKSKLPKDICRKICSYPWFHWFEIETLQLQKERFDCHQQFYRESSEIYSCTLSCLRFEMRLVRFSANGDRPLRRDSREERMYHHVVGRKWKRWCTHRGQWRRQSQGAGNLNAVL